MATIQHSDGAGASLSLCHDLDHANASVLASAPVVAAARARLRFDDQAQVREQAVLVADR